MPEPTLSVIMPTYNGAHFVRRALESLRGPEGPDEVVICDDGSTDETVEICRSFRSELPLRLLRPGRQGSWAAMTNIGLSVATSEWAAILHQDDYWLPGRLTAVRPHMAAYTDLVVTEALYVDGADEPLGPWRIPRRVRARPEEAAASLFVQNWIAVPAATFRTEAARASKGLDQDLWYTADWDLWLNLSRRAPPVCVPRTTAAFRVHRDSLTVTGSRDPVAFRQQLMTVQERHRWAAESAARSGATIAAGRLSNETNVLLASAFHGGASLHPWLAAATNATVSRGVSTYLRNSAIRDRLSARVRMRSRRAADATRSD